MKSYQQLIIFGLLSTSSAFSYVENMRDDMCPNKKVTNHNSVVSCQVSSASAVKSAKVGENLTEVEKQALKFYTYNVVDMSVVDDSGSSIAFSYLRWLVDKDNRKVGLYNLQGWTNYSMETRAKFEVRMNLKGDIVSVTERDW